VKFEDSMIEIEEIIRQIKKGNFRVTEVIEVPIPEGTP
jgi:exonuclease VII small subunit